VLTFFGILVALLVVPAWVAPGADPLARLLWSDLFGLVLLSAVVATGSNLAPGPFLRLSWPRPAALAVAALLGVAGMVVAEAVGVAWISVLPRHLLEQFDVGRLFDQPLAARLGVAAAATLVAPLCEEVAFRGYLFSAVGLRLGPRFTIAATALLFAAIHIDPVRFLPVLGLGVLYGWIAWRTGSIWPSVLAHALNNGIVSTVAIASPGVRLADAVLTPGAMGEALRLGALGLALLVGLGALLLRVTTPPPQEAAVVLRDPGDPSPGFRWARVPARLALALPAALLALALLTLSGWWGTAP
jgi:membrane protease YdiL (CAAX protease family)